MNSIGTKERIAQVMNYLGFDQPIQLARECNASRQQVNGWIKKGAKPDIDQLYTLMKRRGINPFWVLYGEGDMISPLFNLPANHRALFDLVSALPDEKADLCLEALERLVRAIG